MSKPANSSQAEVTASFEKLSDEGKQRPLIEDVRLLGQLLGDTVREQEGEPIFELIESIRRLSVAFQRDANVEAGRDLESLLKRLSPNETLSVIRAWPFFQTNLSNMDMVLAKADLAVARRYADLVPDRGLAERIFAAIESDWD